MNTNPKLYNAAKLADFKISRDLMEYIYEMRLDDDKDYITKQWLSDTLSILKDYEDDGSADDGSLNKQDLLDEMSQLAKIVIGKNIQIIML